jgi:hypothetical protein
MRAGFDRIGRTVTVKQANRQCLGKRRYASKNEARDEASKSAKRHPEWERLHPYGCTICGGYHLSRQRPIEFAEKPKGKAMRAVDRMPAPPNNHHATAPRNGADRPDESENT